MNIKKVVVGPLIENCYILEKDGNAIIIDPGDEYLKIKKELIDLNVIGVFITHAHFDHIGTLNDLLDDYNIPLYYYNVNNEIPYEKLINIEEKEYELNNFKFKCIYTPGHRNDLMTFYFYEDSIMFTGDFLFKGTIGRTDLEYGNYDDMLKSIDKIKKYDNNIKIYPGHGEETTLKEEKENNMYMF